MKIKMRLQALRRYWFHLLLWLVMVLYLLFAPDVFALAFIKTGKPLQTEKRLPSESDQITFVIAGLESYMVDGISFSDLYGWAYIASEQREAAEGFVPEIALVSDKEMYFFNVKTEHRMVADEEAEPNALVFSALIADDTIKPGKYRIGVIFRNPSTGVSYYWDKPAHYLVKTPNTLRLEKR